MSLSGARNFEFNAVSNLIAHLSFLIKKNTVENNKMRDIENELLAKKINDGRIFEPKIQDPLDDVIEILDMPDPEHKKTTFPYVEPTVQLPDEIEEKQKQIDDDFIDLQAKFNNVNYFATEQKEEKEIEDIIESIIKDPIPNNDFWWEEDVFHKNDSHPTINATKIIVDDIKETTDDVSKNIDIQSISDNILKNLRPVDNRTTQELIDDDFISFEDRTKQELEDDDFLSLDENESEIEVDTGPESKIEIDEIDTTSAWDSNKTEIAKPGPTIKLPTDYNRKVKVAKKIKNYLRKKVGQKNNQNKVSKDWLKAAGYLDTKDQDKTKLYICPTKES